MDDISHAPTRRRLWFVPPVMMGVLFVILAIKSQTAPEREPPSEAASPVRVIAAPTLSVIPRALGYGNVQPGSVWDAVAQVGGKVIAVHPQLKKGAILPKGAAILRIDPSDYRLAVAQTEANIRTVEAKLAEIEVKEKNTRASLAIEQRSLELDQTDLKRKEKLLKKGNVSQAALDEKRRAVLGGRQSVQSQRNALNLIPAEREALEAELALNRAKLEEAKLNLERTVIAAPFDCRVSEVNVEQDQYANPGQALASVDGIDVSEVSAQLPIDKMMSLISPSGGGPVEPAAIMGRLHDVLGLTPVVRLRAGSITVEWPARVARISDTIDPQTRTVGVIVAVDDPYRQARPGVRPPLAKNMFVEVELKGRPWAGQVAVPRSALRQGDRIYVVDGESRLEIRPVKVRMAQTNFVVLAGGLAAGEKVVVSDLVPAIAGMLLAPKEDAAAANALVAEAAGEGPVR